MADSFPAPVPDLESAEFWRGCREGRLLLERCTTCGSFRYPPRPSCPRCGSPLGSWVEASGRGVVHSWAVAHHPSHPAMQGKVPYTIVLVELEEGPRMVSNLLDTPFQEIHAGMPVRVVFEPVDDRIALPKFRAIREP